MTVNCLDCWFCVEVFNEDFECTHGNAIPDNGAPCAIGVGEHNCPYFEKDDGDVEWLIVNIEINFVLVVNIFIEKKNMEKIIAN